MTRFARAKGSKASNEKKPEEATSWSEMKKAMLSKNSSKPPEESPLKIMKLKSTTESGHQTEWASLGDVPSLLKPSYLKQNNNSEPDKTSSEDNPKFSKKLKKSNVNFNIPEKKIKLKSTTESGHQAESASLGDAPSLLKPNYLKQNNNSEPDKTSSEDNPKFSKKLKKTNVNGNMNTKKSKEFSSEKKKIINKTSTVSKKEILKNSSTEISDSVDVEKKLSKKKKRLLAKAKKFSNISNGESNNENNISKDEVNKKKKLKTSAQLNEKAASNESNKFDSDHSKKNKKRKFNEECQEDSKNEFVKRKKQISECENNDEDLGNKFVKGNKNPNWSKFQERNSNDKHTRKEKFGEKNNKKSFGKGFNKNFKDRNNFQNGKNKRNFNQDKNGVIDEILVNGKKIPIVKFQGFPVTQDDAERLKKLRLDMIKEGIPKDKLEAALKLERRRAEKALQRLKKAVCFHCRGSGHLLSDCPVLAESQNTSTGICYKCGSTEHSSLHCKVVKGTNFQFAECFICKEQGHIARQCPDNPKGLYPQGGACRECGDVTHLRKDCPKFITKKADEMVTVGVRNDRVLECLDEEILKKEKESVKPMKKRATVKF